MADRKKRQLTMGERSAQDTGVAFFDPKKKKWVVVSAGKDNGEEVSPNASNVEEIDEI